MSSETLSPPAAPSPESAQNDRDTGAVPGARETCYPETLCTRECELIRQRRAQQRQLCDETPAADADADANAPLIGLAISGGGIRSATFALGLLQYFAQQRWLRKIDFLSTVSGGGYIGSFLGRLIVARESIAAAESELAEARAGSVDFLLRNGRYLAPGGRDNLGIAIAYMLRSVLTVQLLFLLMAFLLAWLIQPLGNFLQTLSLTVCTAHPSLCPVTSNYWSPWFSFAVLAGVMFFLFSLAYFLMPVFTRGLHNSQALLQRRYCTTVAQKTALLGLVVALALGAVSLISEAIVSAWQQGKLQALLGSWWLWLLAAAESVVLVVQKIMAWLPTQEDKPARRIPIQIIGALAGAILLLLLVVIGFVSGALTHHLLFDTPLFSGELIPLLIWLLPVAVLLWLGHWTALANSTSLHTFYFSRLVRTFLRASVFRSNGSAPESCQQRGAAEGDLPLAEYQPQRHGGPVHIINCTINETVEADTGLWRPDRKGLNLAVSSHVLHCGARHHLMLREDRADVLAANLDANNWQLLGREFQRSDSPEKFRLFSGCEQHERLSVGHWVAISGAAFSTGLGSMTRWWSSVVCALANVRLGYWWRARDHHDSLLPPLFRLLSNELLGWFRGTRSRYWYLTDGGHFENMGAYELIRRRVPLIIIIDGECDSDYTLQGFANLVRKARLDFACDIRVVGAAGVNGPCADPLALLRGEVVDGWRRNGSRGLYAVGEFIDEPEAEPLRILYIKPAMCGDEPADIQHYRSEHNEFPQQTTLDQFFDEAQWESYRRLGLWTGESLHEDLVGVFGFPSAPAE